MIFAFLLQGTWDTTYATYMDMVYCVQIFFKGDMGYLEK